MIREIRIGSRDSDLAMAQTRLVMEGIARARPELSLRLVSMKTRGDLRPDLPLEKAGGKGLFTGALESALAAGEIDLCVHSLKDMALDQDRELPIIALAKRGDPRDALVLPRPGPLPPGAGGGAGSLPRLLASLRASGLPTGSSSPRRRVQAAALCPELPLAPIRGNVPTRLAKLDGGGYCALILAAAGLLRLGLGARGDYVFSVEEMVPAAGQGALAIQGRRGEDYGFLDAVRHPPTVEAVEAERSFVRAAGGGCDAPVGAYAEISGGEIRLTVLWAPGPGASLCRDRIAGPRERGRQLAEELARRLLERGGGR